MSVLLETRAIKSTRKPWRCDGCNRKFPAGTPKQRQRGISDGVPYTFESCPTCTGVMDALFAIDRDYVIDGVSDDDIAEYVQENFDRWADADAYFGTPIEDEALTGTGQNGDTPAATEGEQR